MASKPRLQLLHTEASFEIPRCEHTPPCDLLLRDPGAFFASKSRAMRANHVCASVCASLLRAWASRHTPNLARALWGAEAPRAPQYLLPVGRDMFAGELDFINLYENRMPTARSPLLDVKDLPNLGVFNGECLAALIVEFALHGLDIELFFLVAPHVGSFPDVNDPYNSIVDGMYPSEVRRRIIGDVTGPAEKDVRHVVSAATNWWTVTMAGYDLDAPSSDSINNDVPSELQVPQTKGGGPPPKDWIMKRKRVKKQIHSFIEKTGHTPTLVVYQRHMGHEKRTWDNWMKRMTEESGQETNWTTLLTEIRQGDLA